MDKYYIIYCKTDGQVYGELDTLDKALLRAALQAEKNLGREYIVFEVIKSFKATPKNYEMHEKDYQ